MINCTTRGQIIIICLMAGLVNKISLYILEFYHKPDSCGRNKIKVELDLSNYAIKSDIRNATSVEFAKKDDLVQVKSDVDKVNIDELENVVIDLS